jgi:RHS repeat-associated protein
VILQTTFLYDPDGPDSIQTVDVQIRGANNEPIIVPVTLPRSTGERLQKSWAIDNFGNATQSLDWGQVDYISAAPIDDVFRHDTTFATFSNGWTWRAPQYELGEKNVSGSPDPDPTLRRTRVTYDSFGDSTLIEGELAGTGGVNRFHATSAAVAPAPVGESVDGWVTRAAYVRGGTGEVMEARRGVVPSTDGPSAACQRSDYDPWVQFPVHARAYSGLCGSSTYLDGFITYDRGFGTATAESSATGATSVVEYDEFGRITRTFAGDRAAAGGFDPTPMTISSYTVSPDGPYQVVRTQTRSGASSYHDSYQYIDGSGRPLVSVSQADTSAGDGGPWIVSGLDDLNGDGTPKRLYRPRFYSGNPLAVPIVHPSGTAAVEYTRDALGRVLQVRDTGVLVHKTQYLGLTTFQFDAEDLGTGPNKDTPSHVIRNGHGKPKYVTEQLKTASGVDFIHTVRLYNAAGQTTYQARVHTDGSGPPDDGRLFVYDSLGRLQYTNESNAAPGATAFLYSYNDQDKLVGTSDPRGCGANLFYDGYGRAKAKDLSPCMAYHAPYTAPDLATGDGTESFSAYDLPDPSQQPSEYDGAVGNLGGHLVSVRDRGAYSTFGYDSHGRLKSTSRAVSKPGVPTASLATRYTGHFYNKTATFDAAGRAASVSTGADVAALLPSGSQVTYQYSGRGNIRSVGSSYGTLMASTTIDADGAPLTMTYGDVAATKATFAYDARRRGSSFTLSRTAPAFWSGTAVAPYTTPGTATTKQTTLAKYVFTYDEMSRPTTIEDQALVAEWPAGARPNRKSFTHDSLGRVLSAASDYHVGTAWTDDPQVSPYAYENGIGDTRPIPARTNTNRSRGQAIAYDWQGNTTSVTDTTNSIFDRSLSDVVNGDGAGGHPNQLTSAGAGAIAAHYDEAGNLEDLLLRRTGTCTGGKCIQRFAYEWDEDGSLARARRWDYTTLPGGEPAYPLLPTRTADWEDNYAYSGTGRVRKTDRNSAGVERHTLEVFDSLRVNRAVYDAGTSDYLRTNANETVYLAGLARAQYIASGVPIRAAGDTTHVFFSAGDHLGSTNVVFDGKTSELVEKVTQDAFGRTESDYRPARWAGYREDYRFTGKEEDVEVGATYFGARYYSPYLGRFMSADPLWIHAAGGDSNPYAYVGGMLSHATDPFGLDTYDKDPDGTTTTVTCSADPNECAASLSGFTPHPAAQPTPPETESSPPDPAPVATPERDPVRGADSKSSVEPPPWEQDRNHPWEPRPPAPHIPTNDQKAEAIRIGLAQGALNFIKPLWLRPVKLRGVVGRDPAETASLAKYQQAGDDGGSAFLNGLTLVFGGEIAEGIGAAAEAASSRGVFLSGSTGPAFDAAKLARIQANLEAQGVGFVTGEEGDRMLRSLGGEAAYLAMEGGQPGVIVLGSNPSRAAVVEELLHLGQHRATGWSPTFGSQVTMFEIQAQHKLLAIGPRLGWSEAELDGIRGALRAWSGQ